MWKAVNGTSIWKSGSDWRYLEHLRVFLIPGQRPVVIPDDIPLTISIKPDPAMHTLVDKYVPKLSSALNQPIGQTTVALDAIEKDARRRETNPR